MKTSYKIIICFILAIICLILMCDAVARDEKGYAFYFALNAVAELALCIKYAKDIIDQYKGIV